jgi:taurine dioxygenase
LPFTDDIFRAVKSAYLTYPVLVFRDQDLSAPQLAAFGRYFGALEGYGDVAYANAPKTVALSQTNTRETPDQMLYLSPDDPDVLIMTNEARSGFHSVGIVDNAEMWHSDASHKAEPYQAIIVHVLRNPASGGDTEFCDLRALYDALPPDVKNRLNGRTATHHWSKAKNPRFAGTLSPSALEEGKRIAALVAEISQPLVRTHPETGRPALYLSPRFTLRIDDVPAEVSDQILNSLFALMDEPDFCYRHQWREKDLMIWDNRCLNHRVRAYPAQDIRCRHRVTVSGDRPFYRPADAAGAL